MTKRKIVVILGVVFFLSVGAISPTALVHKELFVALFGILSPLGQVIFILALMAGGVVVGWRLFIRWVSEE